MKILSLERLKQLESDYKEWLRLHSSTHNHYNDYIRMCEKVKLWKQAVKESVLAENQLPTKNKQSQSTLKNQRLINLDYRNSKKYATKLSTIAIL